MAFAKNITNLLHASNTPERKMANKYTSAEKLHIRDVGILTNSPVLSNSNYVNCLYAPFHTGVDANLLQQIPNNCVHFILPVSRYQYIIHSLRSLNYFSLNECRSLHIVCFILEVLRSGLTEHLFNIIESRTLRDGEYVPIRRLSHSESVFSYSAVCA